jgi:hypothetical protein
MAGDRSREYRGLASECLLLARKTCDAKVRASSLLMAQKWIDLAELAEHDACNQSLRRHGIRVAIGEQLKALYRVSGALPPHFLALLAQLKAENAPHAE